MDEDERNSDEDFIIAVIGNIQPKHDLKKIAQMLLSTKKVNRIKEDKMTIEELIDIYIECAEINNGRP